MVRRANLKIELVGPALKYAGSNATYRLKVSNMGDAGAKEVMAALALPVGVNYVSGIDSPENIDGGLRWNIGLLPAGDERIFDITCQVNTAGQIEIEAATRGAGDLAATDIATTMIEAIADLVLTVRDPTGPLQLSDPCQYEIVIKNRGTKSARNVKIVMQFSEGIEPNTAEGLTHEIATGQVLFTPISQIAPDQEVVLKVNATASKEGTHRFRTQLVCDESDAHEVAEGTTKFFGESRLSTEQNAQGINR